VERLLRPVLDWMTAGGDSWQMDLDYWERRRQMMDEGETFDGPAGDYLSNIDTALDAFSPDADRDWTQIDEAQLRRELDEATANLKRIGYLD
jgi:hypothetical protein